MIYILARPATVLFFIVVLYVLYRFFVSLLNSRRFSRRIDELVNPNDTPDLVGRAQRTHSQVTTAIGQREEDIASLKAERKSLKNLRGNPNES